MLAVVHIWKLFLIADVRNTYTVSTITDNLMCVLSALCCWLTKLVPMTINMILFNISKKESATECLN